MKELFPFLIFLNLKQIKILIYIEIINDTGKRHYKEVMRNCYEFATRWGSQFIKCWKYFEGKGCTRTKLLIGFARIIIAHIKFSLYFAYERRLHLSNINTANFRRLCATFLMEMFIVNCNLTICLTEILEVYCFLCK